ncbi:AEC family transporter [Bradyrhizobium sp. BR 1432]|uniref:AEC family transporter n=1 Tax=Bradyrhizobium sp. BR 1432 TaxID=3447966 RepID=UPI003EE62409
MEVASLVLPVFAIIVTGWLAGEFGYLSRSLADALVHFAYNVAMPALLIVTIAQEPARNLLEWRFLLAFGGGSLICFALVFLAVRASGKHDLASSTIHGMAAAMTNTGFVALPILHAIYGQPAVLPAAVATVFVAAVMFPITVILLEGRDPHGSAHPTGLAKQILLNPMVLSTLIGLVWAITGLPIPAPIATYLNMIAAALTPCALFAIGLGLSVEGLRSNLKASFALAAVKLVVMPLIVYRLCVLWASIHFTRSLPSSARPYRRRKPCTSSRTSTRSRRSWLRPRSRSRRCCRSQRCWSPSICSPDWRAAQADRHRSIWWCCSTWAPNWSRRPTANCTIRSMAR